jgi:tetratricopeptide (TPR) repeat protein
VAAAPPELSSVPPAAWETLIGEFAAPVGDLQLSAPDFKRDKSVQLGPDAAMAVDRELGRAANQYAYSRKVSEPERLIQTIKFLTALAGEWHYPPAFQLAALLALERSGSPEVIAQADQWLTAAASLGGRYAFDLAAVRQSAGDIPGAAAALGLALAASPATRAGDPVLQAYLGLVVQAGDPVPPTGVLASASRGGPVCLHTAVRAGLYLVKQLRPERAEDVGALLLTPQPTAEDLTAVLVALNDQYVPGPRGAAARPSAAAQAGQGAEHDGGAGGEGASSAEAGREGAAASASSGAADVRLYVIAAQGALHQGRPANAAQIARKGLSVHPGHPELLAIAERESADPVASRSVASTRLRPSVPDRRMGTYSSSSLYAQAGRAEKVEKDLVRAEQLYRRAIAADDNTERSIRSLAWLLHRLKRSDEALELLRDPHYPVKEILPHQNMIITILGDQDHWPEAAQMLEEALRPPHPKQVKIGLFKRLISAYQQSRDWEHAKEAADRLLTLDRRNKEFQDIVAELDRVERTGIFNRLDELLADNAWNPEQSRFISPLLTFHLDSCEYAGVNPVKVQSQRLSERDVQELEGLINQLGFRRSGDRAAYNLSEARILRDLNRTEDDRFRKALRGFAAAMGDYCAAEQRAGDVTRAYYAEAVALGGWDDMGQLKVRQFVLSYHPNPKGSADRPPNFERCMTSVVEVQALRRPVLIGLLSLATNSDSVGKEVVARTFHHRGLRQVLYDQINEYLGVPTRTCQGDAAYASAWQEALRRLRRQAEAQRQSLQMLLNRPEPLRTLIEDRQDLERVPALAPTSKLDTDRLSTASEALGQLRRYLEQSSYLDQERLESMIRTALQDQMAGIEANPTTLSLEYLVPLLAKLDRALAAHFEEVERAAEPTGLEVSLVLPSYQPETCTMQVQLAVTNAQRRSPAMDVTLRVLDNPDDYEPVNVPIKVAQSLHDGQSVPCSLHLPVTARAAAEQVLTLKYRLEFTVRSGRRISTEPESLSLRLSRASDWQKIRNPYAEGAPVEDENMFYGRQPLINVLVESLTRSEAKSVVIYGQKRAGKSSVLYHLERALEPPLLPVRFSLLELATSLDHASLLYKIARAFYSRFEDLADDGKPRLDIPEPRLKEFTDSSAPQILFEDYMSGVRQQMQQSAMYRDWRLVLLLDEFTMLYSAIRRGDLPREFMKSWKAKLESKLFSSVVVGNDLMPTFLAAFPNEFQVARQERVSYLDNPAAELLITEPVQMEDGESRYRGDSVARILQLTAGSPYYIQLFCSRLIEHMNAERQPLIGPADVDKVATALVHGDKALLQEQFDNLLTPGDADVSALPEHTVLEVLHACLTGHRRDLHLDGRHADAIPQGRAVLEDLLRRDVIVRESEDRYRIKVGLFAEWLWDRKA